MRRKPDYTIPSASEDRRAELGFDRLFLRPPSPTAKALDRMAKKLQTTRSLAAAYAIHRASVELETLNKEALKEAMKVIQLLETARTEGVDY